LDQLADSAKSVILEQLGMFIPFIGGIFADSYFVIAEVKMLRVPDSFLRPLRLFLVEMPIHEER
jgi:hypothetical protein